MYVRPMLLGFPQYLRTAPVWEVQYDEYGHPSIYEDKQFLEPPSLEPQGHAQGMIEPKRKPSGMDTSPPLSFHDLLFGV